MIGETMFLRNAFLFISLVLSIFKICKEKVIFLIVQYLHCSCLLELLTRILSHSSISNFKTRDNYNSWEKVVRITEKKYSSVNLSIPFNLCTFLSTETNSKL